MRQRSHHQPHRLTASCLPLAVVLTTLALAVWIPPALAGDRKTFPGSACQRWGNINAEIAATDGGGVMNSSFSSTYTVSCPIVRDNTLNTNGVTEFEVYGYRDSSTTTALSCIFYVTNAEDGTTYATRSQTTSLRGDFQLTIPVTKSIADGFYNMLCTLPPRSKIHGYIMSEHD